MLLDLQDEMLELVMHQLSIISGNLGPLMNASAVSKQIALACEVCFERECLKRGWRPPRLPRGEAAAHHCFPWRTLYRQHACRACGACGEYPVRSSQAAPMEFLLCKKCIGLADVRARLVERMYMIDIESLSGRNLLRRKCPPIKRRIRMRR